MAVNTVKATINGQTYTLTLNSSTGKYEATITAPSKSSYNQSGHYYPVSVQATDDAGNVTVAGPEDSIFGESLRLTVKEKVAPVIVITSPGANAYVTNNKPAIKWKVTDDDSGVDVSTIGITIDSGGKITGDSITKIAITGGYECTYTPAQALSDGSHTIKVDAADHDGNAADQKSVTFRVDTIAPSLNVTTPVNELITNNTSCIISGTTNDATSSPVSVTVKVNNGNAQAITVHADGSFSDTVVLASGVNTLTIVATDAAGKSTTVTRTVTLDLGAPVFQSITITPNPIDAGKTYIISVSVTD